MRATIHQLYFLPWLGYFSKLAFSDVFVILDDVHFRKRHFFDRTKIVDMHGNDKWLSLPTGQHFQKSCNDVDITAPDGAYIGNLLRTIRYSYSKARYFEKEWKHLKAAIEKPLFGSANLVEINASIIQNLMALVSIPMPQVQYSSQLAMHCKDPSERIIKICRKLKISSVIVGGGSSLSVHDWSRITDHDINVYMQDYLKNHPVYEQSRRKYAGFIKGLSIVDALLNVGKEGVRSFLIGEQHRPIPVNEQPLYADKGHNVVGEETND